MTTQNNQTQDTLLITGISGQLARRAAELLLDAGLTRIIGTTRKPEKAEALKTRGVDVRQASFDEPAGLADAFRGATRMLLVSTSKIGQRVQQHKNAIDAAKAAGVRHVIYTSIQGADTFPSIVNSEHLETENHLKQSGLSYTILRNNLYTDMLLMKLKPALQWGGFSGCADEGRVAYISREDCARTAAAALTAAYTGSTVFDVNGPQALGHQDLARLASAISGKELTYRNLSAEEFKAGFLKMGMPEIFAQGLTDFDRMAAGGSLQKTSATVKELTGRDAEDPVEFLKRHQAALQP